MEHSTIPTTTIITYQELINQVQNKIVALCANVDTYASLNEVFKTGTTHQVGLTQSDYYDGIPSNRGNHQRYNCSRFYISVSSGVPSKTTSDVITDLTNFFNGLGLPTDKYYYPVDRKNLYNFIYDIAIFCSYKVCMAVASMPPDRGVVAGNQGDGGNKYFTQQSDLLSAIIYSDAIATGGKNLDPQPNGTEDDLDVHDGVISSATRQHPLNASDISALIDSILSNRLGRKIVTVTYGGNITAA